MPKPHGIESDPENLVFPALAVAVETNPAVGDMIKDAVASSKLSHHMLEHIVAELPHRSLALAETSVVVSQRLVDGSESGSPERAVWLVYLSNWLSDLGRWEEALSAIEEAITINRALAQTPTPATLGVWGFWYVPPLVFFICS